MFGGFSTGRNAGDWLRAASSHVLGIRRPAVTGLVQ